MPAMNPNEANQSKQQRTSFRPPWVKEGPTPLPLPSAPWTARARALNNTSTADTQKQECPDNSKPSIVNKKEPVQPVKPATNRVTSPQEKKNTCVIEIRNEPKKEQRKESVCEIKKEPEKEQAKVVQFKNAPEKREKRESTVQAPTAPLPKTTSKSSLTGPKLPPMAPPPPPPPPGLAPPIIKSELTAVKKAKLEALRARPRRRPDWTDMMKEVESGRNLKHVQCNDRSAPILPESKAKGQFVYESEKSTPNAPHKQLLNQIQMGVKLKRVKCDDRSRPNLDGLRKFRRQMTIEEQIQKSMSVADVVAAAAEPDELDDIDKVRDDLQCAKQMLASELRNKEALERENKRLMARLLNLETELEKEKNTKKVDAEKENKARSTADEMLVLQLKGEATEAHQVAKEMEEKYRVTAEELDATRAKLESAWLRNQQLELEMKAGSRTTAPLSKQMSSKKLAASSAAIHNGKGKPEPDDESEYTETETETETESEEDNGEEDTAAAQEKRTLRELKMLSTKLRSYKDKTSSALKERHSLRELLRKQQKQLRQEKKKYKALQKEVDKMAKIMKEDEDDDKLEDDEEAVEEEETETESESEESEEEESSDGDMPEETPVDQKRKNLTNRSKHYENRFGTLKKGNYLLKANIDRLQDDITRQREMSLTLQDDLTSVLAELG